ncbi:MAG TPA: MFS transporter [Syntrophorhabdaceae bacterium]|nr:MFS transporter [Syntrophorhabdaceae bacterium]
MTLFAVVFAVSLGFSMVSPFLPLYLKDVGSGGLGIAVLYFSYGLTRLLLSPVGGSLSDSANRHTLIVMGLTIYCLVALGYLFLSWNLVSWTILFIFQGTAAALVRPLALASIADFVPRNREGTSMGTFDISFYIAMGVGPILGGLARDRFGIQTVFGCLFFLCVLSLFLSILYVSDFSAAGRPSHDKTFRTAFQNRRLLGLASFIFTRSLGITVSAVFLPILLSDLKFSGLKIGTIMAVGTIFTVLFLRPFGKICDRLDRETITKAGGICVALMTCSLPWAKTFWHFAFLCAGIGVCSALTIPATAALLVEEGRFHGMGLTIGFFNSAMNLGLLVGPLLGGVLMNSSSLSSIFYVAGLMGVAGIVCFTVLFQNSVSIKNEVSGA